MSNRHFHLRLSCDYQGTENKVENLVVEVLHEEQWETLDLNIESPGFLLLIYGLFTCQHLYMRTNAAERQLVLASTRGELQVEADERWLIQDVLITFHARIRSGTQTEDALNYIRERMTHCPVSTNLPKDIKIKSTVYLEG